MTKDFNKIGLVLDAIGNPLQGNESVVMIKDSPEQGTTQPLINAGIKEVNTHLVQGNTPPIKLMSIELLKNGMVSRI